MLRIKSLTKLYRTGDLALKGVDLVVPDGQVMALIGPSGAGKSTVIRCINRLVEPTSGSIALNDVDIVTLRSAELRRARRRMGMIFQEYALVERLTVMENVLTGRLGYVGFWRSWLRRFPQTDIDEHSVCSIASASTTWRINAPTNCPAGNASASAFAAL
jgi:phosphonate transport system ATP-binding protein